MSQRLKKLASRARLPSFMREQQPSNARDITPPNLPADVDPYVTPPGQTVQPGHDETPLEAIVTTPSTPPTNTSRIKQLIGSLKVQDKSPKAPVKHIHQQGITGSDLTLPYFDGSSKNPNDHFIDLDSDSMEREPDVRSYFWHVGDEVLHILGVLHGEDPPVDRVDHDQLLVRTGREWLRDYRDKGCGMFLSPKDRCKELNNEPGTAWYRMPTIAICQGIADGSIAALENECGFYDLTPTEDYDQRTNCLVPTNIRAPLWWAECLKDGVRPGTRGWDDMIERAYTDKSHPGYAIYEGIVDRDEMIFYLIRLGSSKDSGAADVYASNRQKADKVLQRDWPRLQLPYRRSQDNFFEPGYLEMQGITVDQFLGRTQ